MGSASEESAAALKIERLNGDNWYTWKYRMQLLLKDKDLWGIVTGEETIEDYSSAAQQKTFKKRAQKAMSTYHWFSCRRSAIDACPKRKRG
jgi:hypothetical protein